MIIQIIDLYFSQKKWLKTIGWICSLQTCRFSLHKMLTGGLEWCGLLLEYCDVFISCLESHSDGTHSLQRIHWWASDELIGLKVIKFSFWVIYSFNTLHICYEWYSIAFGLLHAPFVHMEYYYNHLKHVQQVKTNNSYLTNTSLTLHDMSIP